MRLALADGKQLLRWVAMPVVALVTLLALLWSAVYFTPEAPPHLYHKLAYTPRRAVLMATVPSVRVRAVLANFDAHLPQDWVFTVAHSSRDQAWMRAALLGLQGELQRPRGLQLLDIGPPLLIEDYNEVLTSFSFYDALHCDWALIFQCDTWLLPSSYHIDNFTRWDYIGAPWFIHALAGPPWVGNGGLSLRNVGAMLKACNGSVSHSWNRNEDIFLSRVVPLVGGRVAPASAGRAFSWESEQPPLDGQVPFGVHKPKWFCPFLFYTDQELFFVSSFAAIDVGAKVEWGQLPNTTAALRTCLRPVAGSNTGPQNTEVSVDDELERATKNDVAALPSRPFSAGLPLRQYRAVIFVFRPHRRLARTLTRWSAVLPVEWQIVLLHSLKGPVPRWLASLPELHPLLARSPNCSREL